MGSDVVVRPDQVSLGVLVSAVSRDVIDAAARGCGVADRRSGGKLPVHVVGYLTMALSLFSDDDYEEVAAKVTGSLSMFGCWDAAWSAPTASGITQARKRLGVKVMEQVFEGVAQSVATSGTRGARMRGWRLVAIDGFDVDLPDTPANVAEFGYAGSGDNRSVFPKARVVALAECGTHAFLAAEVAAWSVGEKTLASRLYQRLHADELLTADRNFYSFDAWDIASRTRAGLLWRVPTHLGLLVVKALADGTYLTVMINPKVRGPRREQILAAAHAGRAVEPVDGHVARVVEYDVPDRAGNGSGELIVLLTNIVDPIQATADELADAYHQRWEQETANDQTPTGSLSPAPYEPSAVPPQERRPFPPEAWNNALPHILTEINRKPLSHRWERTCPRAVKRARQNHYRIKQPSEPASTRHNRPPTTRRYPLTKQTT